MPVYIAMRSADGDDAILLYGVGGWVYPKLPKSVAEISEAGGSAQYTIQFAALDNDFGEPTSPVYVDIITDRDGKFAE